MTKHYSSKEFSSHPSSPSRNSLAYNKKVAAVSVAAAAAIVAGLALTVPVSAAQAATATNASADAYTVSTVPTHNYGETDKISVGLDQKDRKTGYLKFSNLGAIESSDVIKIDLRVIGGDAGTLQASQLESSTWSETGINYNNAPATAKVLANATVDNGKQDLTLSVTGISAPDGTVAIALTRSDGGITRIASRESAEADRPAISVNNGEGSQPVPAPTTPPAATTPTTPPVTTPPTTTKPPCRRRPIALSPPSWSPAVAHGSAQPPTRFPVKAGTRH